MIVFLNPHAHGWVHIKRKLNPMGNEYHTATCADTIIIYSVEIVEGRDKLEEGPDSKKQFDSETDSNIAALVARNVFAYSWFGQSCCSWFRL